MAENDLEFNPATDPATAAVPDEQLNLKKRARRRLVGAIALVLLAVIVLPMVMDQEPRPLTQDIQIRIPSQEPASASTFTRIIPGKPTPTPLPPPAPAATPAPVAAVPAAPAAPATPAATPPQERETAHTTEPLNAEQWVVQLGAYQDPANVRLLQGKIKELGYPSFTEKVDTPQGARMRVRSGPFDSREVAEKAHERLKKIGAGAPPGGVVAKK